MSTLNVTIKCVLIGDGAVGKTSLRERYLGRGFSASYMMTIGADFALKKVRVDGETINVQLWDLAGQQHFTRVRTLYYRGIRGLLAVFDVTRDATYKNLEYWINEIKQVITEQELEKIPTVLIGNKVDLRDDGEPSHISSELGEELAIRLAKQMNKGTLPITYIETSAKTGENVPQAFQSLVERIFELN